MSNSCGLIVYIQSLHSSVSKCFESGSAFFWPKSAKNSATEFFQKSTKILVKSATNLISQQFLLHFYAQKCLRFLLFLFFSEKNLIILIKSNENHLKKSLFYLCQFLVFLAYFSCEKFLVIKFLDFLFLMRNCNAY